MSSSGFNLKSEQTEAMCKACDLAVRFRAEIAQEIVKWKAQSNLLPPESKLRLIEHETRKLTSSNALPLAESIAMAAILEHYVDLTS